MQAIDILAENNLSTVVSQYVRTTPRGAAYQSEAELEAVLIAQLGRQGYEYAPIRREDELIQNLRLQLEKLNDFRFTDGEWARFFKTEIANEGQGIVDKAETIQRDNIKAFVRDDGTQKNICLIDRQDPHHNSTQVINQYAASDGQRPNRYDVTILVNGLPLVHIELKRRGVSLKEAFNQIDRYGRESFWAGCSLYEYVQIFVISNGTDTKYYSNTTRDSHIREQVRQGKKPRPKTCNSFEFTSYWADATNQVIGDLEDFTATFLTRHALLNILTRFCVFTDQKILMVMRPYQIAATERLLGQIEIAHNVRRYGTRDGGGYVWHTTGSGKTLTSFKAAQLATQLPYIEKVLFVVDRKDLDYQTMKEYDRFQKGAANGNTSTKELERQLASPTSRIIITTIQKLAHFIKKNPAHDIYKKDVVMIFDECHRSQFGDMHAAIAKRFKKHYLFGFTGTPIFKENISASNAGALKTTEDVFGKRLHAYTIVDAIRDHNVLKFRVAYVSTVKEKENVKDGQVWGIQEEQALMDDRRIANVSRYILEHFDQQTKRASSYTFSKLVNIAEVVSDKRKKVAEARQKTRLDGFNSIFAVQSIAHAKLYYNKLKELQAELPANKRLKVATIFSYAPNEEAVDGEEDEDNDSTARLDPGSRDFLEGAIKDYNQMFNTAYDTSAEKFPNYYKDVSQRMKNRELDILIVVNMFLTGFDATTLNTLWVDKNLRYHGLLQAYSRTNRILNSVKTFGNIVCFRNLEDATNKCLALFGDTKARHVALLRPYEDYLRGYVDEDGKFRKGYLECIEELRARLEPGAKPVGEQAEKDFIRLFGTILKMRNLLSSFDRFAQDDPLRPRDVQDYTSVYIDLAEKYRHGQDREKASINDDLAFEMELVKQVEVTIDYILFLVEEHNRANRPDAEFKAKIARAIASSPDLRDKKELITAFIESLTPHSDVTEKWRAYVDEQKRREFARIVEEENLKKDKARAFMAKVWEIGYVPEGGLELNDILPPINPFDPNGRRSEKLDQVLTRLKAFFAKYCELSSTCGLEDA